MKRLFGSIALVLFIFFIFVTIYSVFIYGNTGYFGFNSFIALIQNSEYANNGYFSIQSALNAFTSDNTGDIILNALSVYIVPTIRLLVALVATLVDYIVMFFGATLGNFNQPLPPDLPSSDWVPLITNYLFRW